MTALVNAAPIMPSSIDLDDRLVGAPAFYLTPATRPTLAEANAWCKNLTTTHYENFHVATFFLPTALRPHFYSVYAFCRTSDDLGDEVADASNATRLLATWRAMLHQCFAEPAASRHPVYVALQPTIVARHLPIQPFDDLISAFEQDQVYTHHESLATLEHYSRYSANPVGRLVLLVSGYHSEELLQLSDEICTGLQLANFYQDVVEDRARGRRYIPADAMQRFHVTDEQLIARKFDANVRAMMQFLVADARDRLTRGQRITSLVAPDLASTLRLFVNGGHAILDAIAAQDYNTLQSRPIVTKAAKLRLLGGALLGKFAASLKPSGSRKGHTRMSVTQSVAQSPELIAAYAACRAIAKREAKNFYYSFRVLPQHKSDAMCAVYAFMRKADDLADDESLTIEARRQAMASWTAEWRASRTSRTNDPIFLALNDTQQRFAISDDLLEQLVAGTTLDLQSEPEGVHTLEIPSAHGPIRTIQIYDSVSALTHYCYLVASVVGLVCIRIFGYTDRRADQLAIDTGIAFQFTNILRDIKEDAERGRIYLPADLLREHAVTPERILSLAAGAAIQPNELALLRALELHAQTLYRSSEQLIPLLDADARPAMRVLVRIYHRLLDRVASDPSAVFRERVSVPTSQKLAILLLGILQSLRARLVG